MTDENSPLSPRHRLIVALDVSTAADARRLVAALGGAVATFKVGKQLFTAAGPEIVREIVEGGYSVFLDLKFHDIPNTVAAAVRSASELGVAMLTVHASGGSKMLRAAAEAARQSPSPPLVLAVTVLTSMTDQDVQEVGISGRVVDQVLRLAELAETAGCGGIVASAREARLVRQALGPRLAIVTPGIRPAGGDADDQARILTPADAIGAGATYLVVGRPITAAPDPAKTARAIVEEIATALQGTNAGG